MFVHFVEHRGVVTLTGLFVEQDVGIPPSLLPSVLHSKVVIKQLIRAGSKQNIFVKFEQIKQLFMNK